MTKKFKEKNKILLDKLNYYINDEKENILVIFLSSELRAQLDESNEIDLPKYKGIRLIDDAYIPAGFLKVITKDDIMVFNTPCLCGIYKDEKHP